MLIHENHIIFYLILIQPTTWPSKCSPRPRPGSDRRTCATWPTCWASGACSAPTISRGCAAAKKPQRCGVYYLSITSRPTPSTKNLNLASTTTSVKSCTGFKRRNSNARPGGGYDAPTNRQIARRRSLGADR